MKNLYHNEMFSFDLNTSIMNYFCINYVLKDIAVIKYYSCSESHKSWMISQFLSCVARLLLVHKFKCCNLMATSYIREDKAILSCFVRGGWGKVTLSDIRSLVWHERVMTATRKGQQEGYVWHQEGWARGPCLTPREVNKRAIFDTRKVQQEGFVWHQERSTRESRLTPGKVNKRAMSEARRGQQEGHVWHQERSTRVPCLAPGNVNRRALFDTRRGQQEGHV